METWFAKPGSTWPAPPRWKTAISATLAIYPVSVVGGLFLMPHLAALPLLLNSLITAAVFNVLMTYVAVPTVSRVLRDWLTHNGPRRHSLTAARRPPGPRSGPFPDQPPPLRPTSDRFSW
ncbi:hypothetical protein [Streptomyces sp. bgisy031]|uniref:hypothetical protein n=1 Tax=Streptomyces sp. bgisy031 TaxID=3413772 RepID=UPI003D70724A